MRRGSTRNSNAIRKRQFRPLTLESLSARELFASDVVLEQAPLATEAIDTRGPKIQQIRFGSSSSPIGTEFSDGLPAVVGASQLQSYPWATIDTITLIFDEQVQVSSSNLQLLSKSIPNLASFSYDNLTFKAVWKFASPLPSGKYSLNLTDRVTDTAGNRLDGEWMDATSQVSGNGQSGGEFRFRFDLHVGDVDNDGEVTMRDRALVEANIGSSSNSRFDLNMSGTTNTTDAELVAAAFGDSLPLRAPNETPLVKNITPSATTNIRYAVVDVDNAGNPAISIIAASDGKILFSRSLDRQFRYIDIEPINRNATFESIALLGVHRATGEVRLWLHNPSLSVAARSLNFGRTWIPIEMEITNDASPSPQVAILGTQNTKPYANRIWIADPQNLQSMGSISLGTNYEAQKFVVVPATANTPAMFAVAGRVPSNGTMRVKTFNVTTNALISNFAINGNPILDFKQIFDLNKNEPVIAALSHPVNGSPQIEVRTLQGTLRRRLTLQTEGNPRELVLWSTSTASPLQFALLTEVGLQREGIVLTGDLLTTQVPRRISFGSGFNNIGLLKFNLTNVDTGLSVLQSSTEIGFAQLKQKYAQNGASYRTVPTSIYTQVTDFFDQNRVHAHTPLAEIDERLGLARSWFESYESENAASLLADMGAQVFTRHVKTGDEDPWWPSEWPSNGSGTSTYSPARNNQGIALAAGANLPQSYINEAIINDTPMIGYYFDATEQNLAISHPEWVCKAYSGSPLTPHPTKGAYLDVTGEYGNVVKQRLLEIAGMGARGVYLDFRHLPAGGCWGTQLAADFQATYGLPAPPSGSSATYVKFMQFQAERVTATLQAWKDAVAQQYPYFHFIISVTSVPGLTRIDMNSDMAAIDSPKSEFSLATQRGQNNSVFFNNPSLYEPDADVRMAFGWSLLRDVATQSLPHIWHALTPNGDQLLSFVSAVNAYGMIAAVHIVEELLQPGSQYAGIASRDDLIAALDFGNKISPHLAGTSPTEWMAVHFPESARDSYGTNSKLAWEKVLLPAVAAFQAGQELGRPVAVFNDDILATGIPDKIRVLYLPNSTNLTAGQQANINAFQNRGGVVISNNGLTQWGQRAGYQSGLEQISNAIRSIPTPVEFVNLPPRVHAVAHSQSALGNDGRIVLALTNDFTYVQGSTIFEPIAANLVNPTPPPVAAGIKAVLRLSDWPQLNANNVEIIAIDPISLQRLTVVRTTETLEVVFPSFAISAWAVIETTPAPANLQLSVPIASALSARTSSSLTLDINADGRVSPLDALAAINALNSSNGLSAAANDQNSAKSIFADVNGDSQLTPLDVLLIINHLNNALSGEGEDSLSHRMPMVLIGPGTQPLRSLQLIEPEFFAAQSAVVSSETNSDLISPNTTEAGVEQERLTGDLFAEAIDTTLSEDLTIVESLFEPLCTAIKRNLR